MTTFGYLNQTGDIVRDYYAEALATIPDISRLDQSVQRLADRVQTFDRAPADRVLSGRRALIEEIKAVAASSDEWPEDIAQRAYDALKLVEMRQAEKTLTETALEVVKGERDQIIRQGSAKAVGHLADPLQELLEAARQALGELDGGRTAQDVLDAGGPAVDAWNRLGTYGDDYAAIRRAQRTLCVNACGGEDGYKPTITFKDWGIEDPTGIRLGTMHLDEVLERGGEVSNYTELNPSWYDDLRANGETVKAFTSWSDNRQHLIDLLDSSAAIWMPSLKQAGEAYALQRKSVKDRAQSYADKNAAGRYAAPEPSRAVIRAHQNDAARHRTNFMATAYDN